MNEMMALLEDNGAIALAAAISMAVSALAAAWSQSAVGSSAVAAAAERPELAGNVLIWMALPEIFAILGFVIAFMLLGKIGGH